MQRELMKTNCRRLSFLVIGLLLSVVGTTNAAPLGTAFTYQGRLADGTNAATTSTTWTSRSSRPLPAGVNWA